MKIISHAKKFKALLVIEEGQPQYIEQELGLLLHKEKINVDLKGKDILPMAGEYTSEVIYKGVFSFINNYIPDFQNFSNLNYNAEIDQLRDESIFFLGGSCSCKTARVLHRVSRKTILFSFKNGGERYRKKSMFLPI